MTSPAEEPTSAIQERPAWYHRTCTTSDEHVVTGKVSGPGALKALLANVGRLWDNGSTITCTFVNPVGTQIQQDKVKTVVKIWEKYVNLKFQFVASRPAIIRISFDTTDGSWSYVGKDILRRPPNTATLNLGWIKEGPAITEGDTGVILHEFGHSIGYLHEHQSLRREEKLHLDEAAVIELFMRTQGWSEAEVRRQIINIVNQFQVGSFSDLDFTSIMMYFMPAELNLERIEIPPNNHLSNIDKAYAVANYPFFGDEDADRELSFEGALDIIGIKGVERDRVLEQYNEKDWQGVRVELARFSTNQKILAGSAAK